MGLFDFLKKGKPSAPSNAQPVARSGKAPKRRPETYEELVDDLLTNSDPGLLAEDRKALVYGAMGPRQVSEAGARMDLLSNLLEKALEAPRADANYEAAIGVLQDYRYLIGESDLTFECPRELERLNRAIVKLYREGGEFVRQKLEYNAESLYNVGFDALRSLDALLLADEAHRGKVLSHISYDYLKTNGQLFCLMDFLAQHRQDAMDAALDEVRQCLREKTHPIIWHRLPDTVAEGSVQDVPSYFRKVYLPFTGREGDAAFADWFDGYWAES